MKKILNVMIVISLLNWICALLVIFVKNRQTTPPLLAYYIILSFIFSVIPSIISAIGAMFLLIDQNQTSLQNRSKLVLTLNSVYLVVFVRMLQWTIG